MAAPADVSPLQKLRVLLIDDGARHIQPIRDELVRQGHEVVGVIDVGDLDPRRRPAAAARRRDRRQRFADPRHAREPRDACPRTTRARSSSSPTTTAAAPMQRALRAGVSAYVIAGLQTERLEPVLQVAIARFEQEAALRAQLDKAEQQLAGRKLIERAKGVLMAEAGLDEDAAYKRLRKLAMDRGKRLADVAQSVIDAQELLRLRG